MGKNKNSGINIMTMSIAFILLALAGFLYIFWNDGEANAETGEKRLPVLSQTGTTIPVDINAMPKTVSDGAGFFSFTVDGVKRYDNSGKVKWDYPLSLTNPVFVDNGPFAGIGEYKGKYFHVFGQAGLSYMVESENEILNFNVAANGYSAVTVASASGGYKVNVYNASGNLITYRIIEDRSNYPFCTAISPDGRVLAISYLNLSGVQMESFICAYYIKSSDGIDYSDSMFASFNRSEGEIISRLNFINDSTLMFFTDMNYGIYELTASSQMKLKWSEELNNEVSFIDTVNDKCVVIAYGKSLVNKDGVAEGTVIAKGIDGKELVNYTIDGPVTYLSCGKEGIIIGGGNTGRKFVCLNYKNKAVWEHDATGDVIDFIVLDRAEKALLVSHGNIQFMEKSKLPVSNSPSPQIDLDEDEMELVSPENSPEPTENTGLESEMPSESAEPTEPFESNPPAETEGSEPLESGEPENTPNP